MISLINTIAKVYEKFIALYISKIAEGSNVLHPGQEALIHLVLWIKAHLRARRAIGTIYLQTLSTHSPQSITCA